MNWIDRALGASAKKWGFGFILFGLVFGCVAGWILSSQVTGGQRPGLVRETFAISALVFWLPWLIVGSSALLAHAFTRNKPEFWSPFQSQITSDICANLDEDEKVRFRRLAGGWGALAGITWVVAIHVMVRMNTRSALPTIAVLILVLLVGAGLSRKRIKRFLASTRYAREHGLGPTDIRYYRGSSKE